MKQTIETEVLAIARRYSRREISSAHSRGAGKGYDYKYRIVWDNYTQFKNELKANCPRGYGWILLTEMREDWECQFPNKKAYCKEVTKIRKEYGLKYDEVADFLAV